MWLSRLWGSVVVLVALAFGFSAATAAFAQGSTIPPPQVAAMLMAKQVMVGYGDGDMRWGNTITRAEAVKMFLAAIGEVAPSLTRAPMPFGDVPQTHWAFSHIALAAEMGLVRGRPGNIFDPDQGVTMAEFMVMVSRVYVGLGSEAGKANTQVQIKPEWAAPEIVGWPDLVELVAEGSAAINLDYPASRGEIGVLAGRMMERLGLAYDITGVLKEYSPAGSRLVLDLGDGRSPVEVAAAGNTLWFLDDAVVMPTALVGRTVHVVLDGPGSAAVVIGGPR